MIIDPIKTTNKINETGFPFQHWCLEVIRNFKEDHNGWRFYAVTEYPYTFPPTNGPLLGVHGTLDILAIRGAERLEKTLLFLVIECKRANDKIKNWFFFQDKINRKPTFCYSDLDNNVPFRKKGRSLIRQLTFPELGYSTVGQYDYCYQGIELNSNLENINVRQNDKIYNFLKQVNHGLRALECTKDKKIESLTADINISIFEHILFIPVLVTTANLYVTSFLDYKDIVSGDLKPGKTDYIPKDWITYEFPLPDFLSFQGEKEVLSNYSTTFIVNDKSFIEFLKKVGIIYAYGAQLKPGTNG